jgi:hypothetical protein
MNTEIAYQAQARAVQTRNKQFFDAAIVGWLVVCLLLAVFSRSIFPAKYFFDSNHIAALFGQYRGFLAGDSYNNTALFYDLTLLSGSLYLTAIITTLIFDTFLLKCLFVLRVDKLAVHNIVVFFFASFAGAVYLAQYSKESLVLLIVFLFFGLSATRKRQIIWLVIAIAYAAYFRSYWFLIVGFYVYYSAAFKVSRNMFVILLSILFAFLLLAVAFQLILHVDLAYYRYSVNDERMYDQNAATMIGPLLPTGNMALEWANAVVQFFMMFFPFPLLTGNPLYLLFFLVTASIGCRLYFIMRQWMRQRSLGKPQKGSRCLALFMSFVTIQSIFEPDYGSYIKHLTPLLPLVLYCFCLQQTSRYERIASYV